jgi:UDP-N-acetylglucosamine 2-epimerase (non-hydrolysing)
MAKIILVAGARPNFMKVAPVMGALATYPRLETILLHTGQHYDAKMSQVFFEALGLSAPDIHLGVGSGTQASQTAKVMVEFEKVLAEERPDIVVVVGDVNSTLGCSVVAAKAGVPVAHIEAGLRSFDRSMPEEINRLVTDSLSEVLFTTSADADANLLREGHAASSIHFVGNTMIDTLLKHRSTALASPAYKKMGLEEGEYILATLHRPANVDDPENFRAVLEALAEAPLPVVFPVHPRTRKVSEEAGLNELLERFVCVPPQGYLEFLSIQAGAKLVLTDSGGVQEETTVLGVPCLTFRDNTERPVTVTHGTNRLIGTDPYRISEEIELTLKSPPDFKEAPTLWDGRASKRIAAALDDIL